MARLILLLHRYLGIAVGALMVMWCLTGIVMMYVSYPALAESARLEHLEPIAWNGCCSLSPALRADVRPGRIAIEMLNGRPVLHTGAPHPIDLRTGAAIEGISVDQAAEVAKRFMRSPSPQAPHLLGLVDRDQWTVSGDFDSERPLYRFALGDDPGTELYISSRSGRAVQLTSSRERFWNWLGAVPHWLYFTELRRHPGVWNQVVIYASLLGCLLVAIGIYIGVRQMAAQPAGRWSPYVGFNWWHHMAGLLFGVFTLTWILSGLFSMNPWGWFQGADARIESATIEGEPGLSATRLGGALQSLADGQPVAESVIAAPLNSRIFFIAGSGSGERRRLNDRGEQAPLGSAELKFLADALQGAAAHGVPELLRQEDNYYFSHHRELAPLPVYRLVLASGTRYYLDSVSGMLIAKLDADGRAYRWWHEGLHRADFAAWVRVRPRWDLLMLLLMSGVTTVCVTGAYLGYRRLTR